MSLFLAVSMLGCLLCGGCGKKDEASDKEQASGTPSAEPDGSEGEGQETVGKEDLFAKIDEEGMEKVTLDGATGTQMIITANKTECHMDGDLVSQGAYPLIELTGEAKEKYPELAKKLADISSGLEETARNTTGTNGPLCVDMRRTMELEDGSDYYFFYETDAKLLGFDDMICTIQINYGDFSGGAHPNSWTTIMNIAPDTAKEIKLASVIDDDKGFTDHIYDELLKAYPDYELETLDDLKSNIEGIYDSSEYTWYLDDTGLNIIFDPYEIAYYALGTMQVTLSYDDYPTLIKDRYRKKGKQDLTKIVAYEEASEVQEIEPIYDGSFYGEITSDFIENPTWKRYAKDGLVKTNTLIQLDQTYAKSTDWLNNEEWVRDYGFENEALSLPYFDGSYYYEPYDYRDFEYMYQSIRIRDGGPEGEILYDLDLSQVCNGPDQAASKYSATTQYIRFAKLLNGILYVSILHNGYSSEESDACTVVAIDLDTKEVIWRSDPLTCNSDNFLIVQDEALICGYGFTAEPDFIYVLDLGDGSVVKKIPVKSAAYYFVLRDNKLHVCTYNTDYIYDVSFG